MDTIHVVNKMASLLLWILCSLALGHITLSVCNYGGYPVVQIPVSIIGSLIVIWLCKKWDYVYLRKIGQWSLFLLCGHALRKPCFNAIGMDITTMSWNPLINFAVEIFLQLTFAVVAGYISSLLIRYSQIKFSHLTGRT